MCGFIGRVKLRLILNSSTVEERLTATRPTRPDGCKEWVSVGGLIEVLHCRLSIVTDHPWPINHFRMTPLMFA